eukprot:scaffold46676_cov22-Cyclotella_meneghiniana.AAC.3
MKVLLGVLLLNRKLKGVPTSWPAHLENLPEAYRSIAYFGSANCEESQLAGMLAWRIFPKLTARSLILDHSHLAM